ncbi:MAG: prolyl oligopeptidase family protein [Prevotella sp.]
MKALSTFLTAIIMALPQTAPAQINYPHTPKDNTVDVYFGTEVADPYRWLENDTSKATVEWVEAQNKVTDAYLSKLPLRKKMLTRLRQLCNYERIGIPFKRNGKYYIYRNNGLQNQSVLYTMDKPGGEERVFLDPNTLSDDGTVALMGISFSNNGKYAAYYISRSGSDWMEFYVIDLATGKLLDDHIVWAKFSGASWQGDGFYYSAYDAPVEGKELSGVNEVHKVYYHRIGTPQSEDVLFYQNPAYPKRFYNISVNEEETMAFLYENGDGAGNNIYVRDLRKKDAQFIQMTSDMNFSYYPIETIGDTIYLHTNYGAPRNKLMKTTLDAPGLKDWQEVVPETDIVLEDADIIGGKMILTYMKDALSHAYIYDLNGKRLDEVKLPMIGSVGFSGKKDEKECFYYFTSYTVPGTVYSYDIDKNESSVFAAPKVPFNIDDYTSEQVFFTSKDGTRVPMSITYRKGMKKNGRNPVLLHGYGGFNTALTPAFSASRIAFLERGGIFAEANLRGGNEYGEEWHMAGTKMQKQNVFDDFIAAAEYLIAEKYTDSAHLAIIGGSNGGLLVGACMTQRPELFAVAVPEVGVMDMLRYHKFTIGWNWASDYGTSEDSKEMFEYLYNYSPLHNLKPGTAYPATLVTTADHDDRVVPAHSFKFAATLQACQSGTNPTLIRIDTKAGHGSGKPLAKQMEETADIYSFILYNIGKKK